MQAGSSAGDSWRSRVNDEVRTVDCGELSRSGDELRQSDWVEQNATVQPGLTPYHTHAHERYSSIESCPRAR